ncbi:MAG: bifunctional DNA-formamidopyrimidine glycosylase/DNA-(apurinic or apyrimidinic site) lyase, partial [candidate division Zixibacteria bacterium]|nr:bifunctional DNA-formamidopyrimidine glycosylase/DNA-(apurinic or apyrimidinic site) lyase [candidate division Zixibacteria bacterium]
TLRRVRFASLRISRANLRGWKRQLTGHAVTSITRRGKFILVGLSDDHTMVIHLRMTGRLWVKPLPYRRSPYDRCVIELASGRVLILADTRQFARVQWVGPGRLDTHPSLEILGPDALTIQLDELRVLLRQSRRPIKALLLDQTRIAGLGNIYVDESLHAAGIRPTVPSSRLGRERVIRLRAAIVDILTRAIAACGTTFDTFSDVGGEAGGFGPQLRVYHRHGQPCDQCGARIRRIVIAGRGTHYCPRCQR